MMFLRRAARGAVVWAAAVGAVTALTVAPSVAAGASSRAIVPDGVYRIAFGGDEDALLTSLWNHEGTPAVLLPPLGEPGHREWQLVRDSKTTQLIKNLRSGLYLTLGGREPRDHRSIVASPYPFSWTVRTGSAPGRVSISVPGDGFFQLDRSPQLIHPPRVDIQDPRDDLSQEWVLTPHE